MAMGVLLELRADEREKTLINMLADYEYRYDDSSDMHSSSNNSDDDDENGDSALEQHSYSSLSRSKESIKPALRRPSIAVRSPLSFSLSSLPTLQQQQPLNQHQSQPGTNVSPTFHSPYLSYSSFSPASFFVPLAPRPAYVPSAAYARNGSAIGLPASHRKPLLAVRTFNIPQLVSHLGLKNISSPVGDDAKRPEASLCLQDELETADGTVPLALRALLYGIPNPVATDDMRYAFVIGVVGNAKVYHYKAKRKVNQLGTRRARVQGFS
jgi:hypothetical protein